MTKDLGATSILFIESDSNRHLGLFYDLKTFPNIDFVTFPNHINLVRKVLTRVSPTLSFLTATYGSIKKRYDRIVIVDTALACMDESVLNMLRKLGGTLTVIVLNSLSASSPSFEGAKRLLFSFPPESIYTFDRIEAEQYGFCYLGLAYYSAHVLPDIPCEQDVYFAGGLKGGREGEIIRLCNHLEKSGLGTCFECVNVTGANVPKRVPHGFHLVSRRWVPYERVLEGVAQSRCIVELLQDGQHAQSIRYFESVCYNKNLLTNNPGVFDLPYYDPNHMFYFQSIDDIDCERIARAATPDFGYKGEFSPINLRLFE